MHIYKIYTYLKSPDINRRDHWAEAQRKESGHGGQKSYGSGPVQGQKGEGRGVETGNHGMRGTDARGSGMHQL